MDQLARAEKVNAEGAAKLVFIKMNYLGKKDKGHHLYQFNRIAILKLNN